MIPQANITAWRASVPWADDAQVEQDLVLSRAVIELFDDDGLANTLALRGGTALYKLFLERTYRYSEDIDLVQIEAGPIGSAIDAIRRTLDPWLGRPRRSRGPGTVTLTYRFESEIAPVRPMRLKIEINTREHFSLLGWKSCKFAAQNPWFTGESDVRTFEIDELLATKLRALYQRRKGRDLFDLWLCIVQGLIDPQRVVRCFAEYMEREGHPLTRAQFEQNLNEKAADPAFLSDLGPLLLPEIAYDASAAIAVVRQSLIEQIPGATWRGNAIQKPPRSRRRYNGSSNATEE